MQGLLAVVSFSLPSPALDNTTPEDYACTDGTAGGRAGVHVSSSVPTQGAAVCARLLGKRAALPGGGRRGIHLQAIPRAAQALLALVAHGAHPPPVLQQHGAAVP